MKLFNRLIWPFLAALLALGPVAHAQNNQQRQVVLGRPAPQPALDCNFALSGAAPVGPNCAGFAFSRSSAATTSLYTDAAGSAVTSFLANVPRFLPTGLLVEESRVNSLINSAAPVTQTTPSMATGSYAFWCIGTGSVTSSAGTATASGLGALTCSQSTWQTIVVTGAGTLTFTKSGSVDRFQLELGLFPTSFISTAGAASTRSIDLPTASVSSTSIPSAPTALTFVGKFITPPGFSTATAYHVMEIDDGTVGNRIVMRFVASAGSALQLITVLGSSAQYTLTNFTAPPANTTIRYWAAIAPRNIATQAFSPINLQQKQVTNIGTALPSGLTTIRFGQQVSFQPLDFTIARAQIYTVRIPDGKAYAIAAGM